MQRVYCYTKIAVGFNLAVYEEEIVSDMFIREVNHHLFSEPQLQQASDKRQGGPQNPQSDDQQH